jgi:murein L,D-transpeptidase YafK
MGLVAVHGSRWYPVCSTARCPDPSQQGARRVTLTARHASGGAIMKVVRWVFSLYLLLSFSAYAAENIFADKILIEKKARRLTLLSQDRVLKTYTVALGKKPEGAKMQENDMKTPEGTYIIDARNEKSDYHLSLHISYPNEKDTKRAQKLGVLPGGKIMIHGIKNGWGWVGPLHTWVDWTKGCIAVTDDEMEAIYKIVPNGTVVEIKP